MKAAEGPLYLSAAQRSLVADILEPRNIPGAAVGIVEAGQFSAFEGFGFADIGSGRPVTPDSLFRVASITKTVTATAILRLRDAGRLDLDDPLCFEISKGRGAGEFCHFRVSDAGRILAFSLGGAVYWKMSEARDGVSDMP